jgi:hypothetical protein
MKVLREGVKDRVAKGGRMMRTAIGSDENSELTDALVAELEKRGLEIGVASAIVAGDPRPVRAVIGSASGEHCNLRPTRCVAIRLTARDKGNPT